MSTEVAVPRQLPPARERPAISPPSRSRLPSLTGLRIFGSVAVVLCHIGHGFANAPSLTVAEAYGYAGVSFFFMLSRVRADLDGCSSPGPPTTPPTPAATA